MRTLLVTLLLAATVIPVGAQASSCEVRPYVDCHVAVGPASAGATIDTRWWPLEGEFYHCVDVGGVLERLLCQRYILA